MTSALSIAASGINAAGRTFETAARSVVSAGVANRSTDPGSAPEPAKMSASAPSSVPVFDGPDLAESLVDLKRAEIGYKAQLETFRVAADMQREAVDMLA